jgi:aspartyl-tRNA(Asn)/glutamyl-tRNA(Gln) amidotransferase subunit A
MSDTDLLYTPAARSAALIRSRELSPVEYLDTVLKAAEQTQPRLNCFREMMADQARRDAKAAEKAVTDGARLGPLHGVPVSVKDLIDVAGVHTRHGSAIFEDNLAKSDDVLVQRLRAAGAIVFAKSTTAEFGVKGLTDGPSFGITRNPWNLERTPGGSSGGGAAAVRPASVRSPWAPTARARSADQPHAAVSSVSRSLSARCRPIPRAMPSPATSMPGRLPAASPTPRSCMRS